LDAAVNWAVFISQARGGEGTRLRRDEECIECQLQKFKEDFKAMKNEETITPAYLFLVFGGVFSLLGNLRVPLPSMVRLKVPLPED
jgi:hypothetical protein